MSLESEIKELGQYINKLTEQLAQMSNSSNPVEAKPEAEVEAKPEAEVEAKPEAKPKKTRKPRKKKEEILPESEDSEVEDSEVEDSEVEDSEVEDSPSVETVQALARTALGEGINRDEIKNKVKTLGADKIDQLGPVELTKLEKYLNNQIKKVSEEI